MIATAPIARCGTRDLELVGGAHSVGRYLALLTTFNWVFTLYTLGITTMRFSLPILCPVTKYNSGEKYFVVISLKEPILWDF